MTSIRKRKFQINCHYLLRMWGHRFEAEMAKKSCPQEVVYRVARAKDDEIVLETTNRLEARDAIVKAARQKKAKLYLVMDAHVEPFTEEEMA